MEIDESHMPDVKKYLNSKLGHQGVERCDWELKKSIMHFTYKPTRFIKVTCTLPKHINQLKQLVEKGLSWSND
jgi:hypothetical protein